MTAVPRILQRAEHPISRGYIDKDALHVLYRLHKAGFKGFLVGGSVRDLMTGRTPKDFDVGTDARPEQIRRVFRNSRIIGRRFRLAHVYFDGGKYVEVSTFRGRPEAVDAEQRIEGDADLLIRSDNTFGTPEEDAVRRDFTINGLFYDIATFNVLDYVGGVDDLAARVVRTIGEPEIRFREDPVRMLRACEFAARLDFELEPKLVDALAEVGTELRKSAAPRVTEELLDPLRRGWGRATYALWSQTGLLAVVFPELDREVGGVGDSAPPHAPVFWRMLEEADQRKAQGASLPDAALLGLLFLPLVLAAVKRGAGEGKKVDPARILVLLDEVVNLPALRLALPNQNVHLLKQGLYTLGRLAETRPGDAAARRLVARPYFPVAVAILAIYAKASGRYRDAAAAWEEVLDRGGGHGSSPADFTRTTPFPEALVPLPALADPRASTGPRRRRRRGRAPGSVPAAARID